MSMSVGAGTFEAKRNTSALVAIRPCLYLGLGSSHQEQTPADWRHPGP